MDVYTGHAHGYVRRRLRRHACRRLYMRVPRHVHRDVIGATGRQAGVRVSHDVALPEIIPTVRQLPLLEHYVVLPKKKRQVAVITGMLEQ